MSISGYYFYYCGISAQPNDENQYEDAGEFDVYLHLCQEEMNDKEPKRQTFLETNYFTSQWIEINLRFRISYRDGREDINRYFDLLKEMMENQLYISIVDIKVENIA